MITMVELKYGNCSVVVENYPCNQKTQMGVADWTLIFRSKQDVVDHIALLNKALEFWEYDA